MIQPLRAWHRRAFAALAVALPGTLAAALWVRPAAPADLPRRPGKATVVYESHSDWRSHPITTRILLSDGNRVLTLRPRGQILEPDVLVYLTTTRPVRELPEDARLLGALHPDATYTLPPALARESALVLYSAARREIVDTARLEFAP